MFEGHDFAQGVLLVIGALFPIVNPLGNAPVFLTMTANADPATRARLARKVAINGFVLLMGSLFLGNLLLEFFGVSIPAVQVAGGFVVCKLGWSMLAEADDDTTTPAPATTSALRINLLGARHRTRMVDNDAGCRRDDPRPPGKLVICRGSWPRVAPIYGRAFPQCWLRCFCGGRRCSLVIFSHSLAAEFSMGRLR